MSASATMVEIVEVGPRDGLQNEGTLVSAADKVALVRRLIAAGARRIELTSFVNPAKVPQMADAEAVVEQLGRVEGVTRIGLVLNERGAQRALACGLEQLGAVASASDQFGIRNQGQDSAASVVMAEAIIRSARAAGRTAQVTISMAFGCPFEGAVDPRRVVEMAARLAEAGPVEIGLADTIGVAVPTEVSALVRQVAAAIAPLPVRGHFHDTRGTGIANVWAAIGAGARVIDTAVGGLGGCPFAPGAAGNVASEDVAYLLARSGIATGLDLDQLVQTAQWLEQVMGKPMPSMLSKAGVLTSSGSSA